MRLLGGLLGAGGCIVCLGAIFVIVMVGLVFWYWRNQPKQETSATAPEPPIQATIEHPTAAAPAGSQAASESTSAEAPSEATPPSA